jgi:hypothetical protein
LYRERRRSGPWPGDPLGFFTPFPRRFLSGSELLPFFPQEKTASDIFAGPTLKHRVPFENDLERLNPRWVASTMTLISRKKIEEIFIFLLRTNSILG